MHDDGAQESDHSISEYRCRQNRENSRRGLGFLIVEANPC